MPVDPCASSLELAMEYHRSGKRPQAEQIYRRILAEDNEHVDANYLLGLIELERGEFFIAALLISKSRDMSPTNPLYHYNLGRALQGAGRWGEAEESYRKALQHKDGYIETRYALANLLQATGRSDDAIVEYQKILRVDSSLAAVYNNLGNALRCVGRVEEGLENLLKAVEIEPNYAQGWGNLGNLLKLVGRNEEAREAFEKSLGLDPNDPAQHYNYGNLKQEICDYDGAVAEYLTALRLNPIFAGAYNNLGNVYKLLGKLKLAFAAFESAIRLEPDCADLWNNIGNAQVAVGDIIPAIGSYRKAVDLDPGFVAAYTNLLYALNFPAKIDERTIFEQHREWSLRFERLVGVSQEVKVCPLQKRKLRIGYVSGDFRRHSVAFFFEPLLESHDRSRFEIYCYANYRASDDVTRRIMTVCDHWRPVSRLDDDQAADMIRKDCIDVLIDLSGHTDGNRLLIFARSPAPVQVTWLGYPNTTGLNRIGYRLVDEITDPVGEVDRLATETLYRLPNGFLCYRGYELAPDVMPPPSLDKGYITFGSFNNLTKVNREVAEFWAQILRSVPNSRLLLKTNQLEDADTREKYYRWFADLGIERERIDLRARTAGLAEHLSVYGEVDIALDTFPYNGTTTTCEALWMGVPVLALDGNCHRSRVSKSILIHAGLPELVAAGHEDLLARIHTMIADPDAMRSQREGMRHRVAVSQLCNQKGFAKTMEEAYLAFFDRARQIS